MTEQEVNEEKLLNKIIRKKVLWSEIKAKEQEYQRLQKQIDELEQAKRDISFDIQKRVDESEKIAEWLDQKQYESFLDFFRLKKKQQQQ